MWHVVYRNRACSTSDMVRELKGASIAHFVPERAVERYDESTAEMVPATVIAINNIVFIDTDGDINAVIQKVASLSAPMTDPMTGQPATVPVDEMLAFKLAIHSRPEDVKLLSDPFVRFEDRPLVRVKEGLFKGYITLDTGDNKIIDKMCAALKQIHEIEKAHRK